MSKKQTNTERKPSALRRLLWANVIAALALLTTSVVVLWALGLLQSMVAFFF